MDDNKKPLPPLPEEAAGEKQENNLPPLPQESRQGEEEKPYKRVMRYTVGIAMVIFVLIGVVMLWTFISDVLMDERDEVATQHVELQQYVVNDPPADLRRSHVRMKPGSHPEAGYIADESVLIREKVEDAKFREQNGLPAEGQGKQAKPTDKAKEQPKKEASAAQESAPQQSKHEESRPAKAPETGGGAAQQSRSAAPVTME